MQSKFSQAQTHKFVKVPSKKPIVTQKSLENNQPFVFQGNFIGYMDMYSDADTVANYLDAHDHWFVSCAHPMRVEPLGDNGYILVVGRFSSFGYEVEPKVALVFHLAQNRVYKMHTVPVPNYQYPGYEVQYDAAMELQEVTPEEILSTKLTKVFSHNRSIPPLMTRVDWQLDLVVTVDFPKFIYKLPVSLIQKTGDRLLAQIVRQISPRLTYKVQKDFHTRLKLPIPPKTGRQLQRVKKIDNPSQEQAA
ncbi:MAG: DUF1997 domain-containing protein [Xenococcus sp. (in: cyanobacteria)]